VQEVSEISRSLKALARELHVPVLAGAQLSRGVEQRAGQRPLLSDLRESGSIEQDSDVVMFLHHPDAWDEDPQRKQVTELLVSKHRNGKTGSMELVFLPAYAQFVDAAHRTVVLQD
jgi:replicative DNA helicase